MKICFLTLLLICLSCPIAAKTNVYFSPSKKCEKSIIKLINQAQNNIDIVVYAINNDNICNSLINAHSRGIKIRILTDKTQASLKSSKAIELFKQGFDIRVHSKFKIEHNKFAVFDSKIVSSGSYNWTNSASSKNSENCIFFIKNKNIVQRYQKRFDYLWQQNSKQKSQKWFVQKLNEKP